MLDLWALHGRQRRFAVRRRSAAQRSRNAGYLFFVGNRKATPLPSIRQQDDGRLVCLRHERRAILPETMVRIGGTYKYS